MPDDEKTEVTEQTQDSKVDEALAAFLEDDDDGKKIEVEDKTGDEEPEKEPEKSDKKEPDKSDKSEKDKKTGDDKDEKVDKEEPVFSDALDQRLKDLDTKKEDKQEKKIDKEPEEKEDPEKKPEDKKTPPVDKKFDLSEIDFSLSDDDLTDDMKEYKGDYPEDFKAITEISAIQTRKAIAELIKAGVLKPTFDDSQYAKAKDVKEQKAMLTDMAFWNDVSEIHPDARKINKSKEFIDWVNKKENEPIRRLAQNLEIPEDAVMVLDYYKTSQAKDKADKHDKKSGKDKKHHDDLHKGSMRNKAGMKQTGDEVDMDDAEAAFDEDD